MNTSFPPPRSHHYHLSSPTDPLLPPLPPTSPHPIPPSALPLVNDNGPHRCAELLNYVLLKDLDPCLESVRTRLLSPPLAYSCLSSFRQPHGSSRLLHCLTPLFSCVGNELLAGVTRRSASAALENQSTALHRPGTFAAAVPALTSLVAPFKTLRTVL
jgi:hypothetical protein